MGHLEWHVRHCRSDLRALLRYRGAAFLAAFGVASHASRREPVRPTLKHRSFPESCERAGAWRALLIGSLAPLLISSAFGQTCSTPNGYAPSLAGWSSVSGAVYETATATCGSYNWSTMRCVPRGGEPSAGNFVWCDCYNNGDPNAYYTWNPVGWAVRQYSCPLGGTFISNPYCVCNYPQEGFAFGRCRALDANYCALPRPDKKSNNPSLACGSGEDLDVGNPIHVGSGNKKQSVWLLGHSLLEVTLSYNSAFSQFGDPYSPLLKGNARSGPGWSLSLDQRLVVHETGVNALRAAGESAFFQPVTFAREVDALTSLRQATSSYQPTAYRLTDQYVRRVEDYDVDGRLLEVIDAQGRNARFTYANGAGKFPVGAPACGSGTRPDRTLMCVTDNFGRSIDLFYDAQRRLSRLSDPAGGEVAFAYDEPTSVVLAGQPVGNNLTSLRFPDGSRKQFHYNEQLNTSTANLPNSLTGISVEHPVGTFLRYSTYRYDGAGRAVSTELAGSVNRYTVNYATPYVASTVTDPLGTTRTLQLTNILGLLRQASQSQPAGSGCGPSSSSITYDTQANVSSRTDFNNNKVCYAYDLSRNLETKRVEGLGGSAVCSTALSSPPTGARIISTQWHPDWRLETRIAEPKKLTTITYNGQGATCAPSNVLVDGKPPAVICTRTEQATTDEAGAAGFAATVTGTAKTWRYTYTTYGRVLTATDPNNRVTTTSYHADNDPDLGKRGNVASITNAANHTTHITDYNPHGQPTRIVDPNGVVTTLTYDPRMRLTSRTVGNEATVFGYDPVGQMTSVNLPDGAKLTYTYDAAHRLTAINDHKGNRLDYTLDAMGNRITEKTKDPAGVLVGNIARVIDALNRVQQVTGAGQ